MKYDLRISPGKYGQITIEDLHKITSNLKLEELFKKNDQLEKIKIQNKNMDFRAEELKLTLEDFIFIKELGAG